jgi:penicillin amidase
MRNRHRIFLAHLVSWIAFSAVAWAGVPADTLRLKGLSQPVELLRDRWGISHIYAQTERDLFFAQGFWAHGKYFPVFFSREKVESVIESVTVLMPGR